MKNQRMELRPVSVADLPFLTEMTLLAAFPPGPSPEGASDMPHVTRWTVDWGRPGDVGVVAWSDGQRLGAAWCRLQADALARSDAGDPLPEVAIAVLPEHRARGIGTQMLTALDRAAAAGGQRALSLTVNALNPALHLYERAGFDVVLREGDRLTMVRLLVTPGPDTAPVSSAGARVGHRRNPSPKAHTPAVAEGNRVPDEATPTGSLSRLVIFDLDNTLANRQRFFGEWAAALIRERHLDPETALTILQDADEDGVAPRTVFFEQVRARLGLADPVDDLIDRYWRDQIGRYRCDDETIAGLRLLRRLGYKTGIATNGGVRQIDKIKACGLDRLVDACCVSRVVGFAKPDARLFGALAVKCATSLDHAWVVGDRPETDIAGAVAIGARSVWLRRGHDWTNADYGPTLVAETAAEAIQFIVVADG